MRDYAFTLDKHLVEYADPHISDAAESVLRELHELGRLASRYYGGSAGSDRKRRSSIDLGNPATSHLIQRYPAFGPWLATVPSAAALHPLYEPESPAYLSGVAIDDGTREWFRNIADAHGIRSRAHVLRQLLEEAAGADSRAQRWLSLACGAAQPVVDAMEQLHAAGEQVPHATLADLDRGALQHAVRYASERDLGDRVSVHRVNVLARRGFDTGPSWYTGGIRRGRKRNWSLAFDIVDAVGILEYLKPEDWTYTYTGIITTRRKLAGAVTLLRNAFACVRPGGLLVVGNMLDTHPQLQFTLNVVQWPHIQPRSVEQMLALFEAAGITGHVDVHLPSDGVYSIYAIRKPA